jgi:hypothetical protein
MTLRAEAAASVETQQEQFSGKFGLWTTKNQIKSRLDIEFMPNINIRQNVGQRKNVA